MSKRLRQAREQSTGKGDVELRVRHVTNTDSQSLTTARNLFCIGRLVNDLLGSHVAK